MRTWLISGMNARWRAKAGEARGALVRIGDAQDGGLVESATDDLEGQRKAVRKPARDRYARQARDVRREGAGVIEVHRQRVVHLRADLERHRRRGRRQDRVDG